MKESATNEEKENGNKAGRGEERRMNKINEIEEKRGKLHIRQVHLIDGSADV